MIIFGHVIDTSEMSEDQLDDLRNLNGPGELIFCECYSTSGFDPEVAVLGVKLSSISTLFNPVSVTEIFNAASQHMHIPTNVREELNALKTELGLTSAAQVYVFEDTDD
jgi:hypothetical protein